MGFLLEQRFIGKVIKLFIKTKIMKDPNKKKLKTHQKEIYNLDRIKLWIPTTVNRLLSQSEILINLVLQLENDWLAWN